MNDKQLTAAVAAALNPHAPYSAKVSAVLCEKSNDGRYIGWPEADSYRYNERWIECTAAPGIVRHNRALAARLIACMG